MYFIVKINGIYLWTVFICVKNQENANNRSNDRNMLLYLSSNNLKLREISMSNAIICYDIKSMH